MEPALRERERDRERERESKRECVCERVRERERARGIDRQGESGWQIHLVEGGKTCPCSRDGDVHRPVNLPTSEKIKMFHRLLPGAKVRTWT